MRPERASLPARTYQIILAVGLVAGLALNLPGHLSTDSIITLAEARTDTRLTWAPAAFSWIIGLFDDLVAGTGLYVTASAALLFLSLMSLVRLRPRAGWLAAGLALLAIATPQLLIYQGIVWRDVLFANLTIAGFIFLAHAARDWARRAPVLPLAGALVVLTLAALVRQNGLILVLAAAAVLGWTVRGQGKRAMIAWGLGAVVATAALGLVLNVVVQPPKKAPGLREDAAARILQHYDVVGVAARNPSVTLDEIGAANPAGRDVIRANAKRLYTPARIDTLDPEDAFRQSLWRTPDAAMAAQWREVILEHPGDYLAHRLDVFRWVVLTPRLDQCLPVHVGVSGPETMVRDLGLTNGQDPADRRAAAYAAKFYGTPVYSHLAFGFLSLAMIALLLRRREPADWVMAALLAGGLVFAASFAAISVACDYRYLYLVDLAAITAALYLALDLPGRRAR